MNSLNNKIDEAATLFQTHDFKKSLQAYEQCISICKKNQESKNLLHNLISVRGALLSILGDQKSALECLNEVLSQDPYHSLCLLRRSHVYKKKNQLNKALKDIKTLGNFSPDNLQVAALKVEIQNLKLKSKQINSSSQSESESSNSDIDLDEEQKLNFSNLRDIDRKSVSIMIKPGGNSRKSRVTIAGDIAIQYDAPEEDQKQDSKSFASTNVSKQYLKEKYVKTFREIELDDEEQENQHEISSIKQFDTPIIKVKNTPARTKSILKNRNSTIYVNNEQPVQKEKKYGGRQSKMIDLLKNIDGKVIVNVNEERTSKSLKQVEFRKSIFGGGVEQFSILQTNQVSQNQKPKPPQRKSCLKQRTSFDLPTQNTAINPNQQQRRSKFQMLPKTGIDGIVVKNKRKSIESDGIKQNLGNNNDTSSDSDEGSSHNIFGSNQLVISKEVRENLGLGQESEEIKKPANKIPRATGGKSILKKMSVLHKTDKKQEEKQIVKEAKKAKKSVMFTRFD